jgi:hypothetical protein
MYFFAYVVILYNYPSASGLGELLTTSDSKKNLLRNVTLGLGIDGIFLNTIMNLRIP